MQFVTLLLKVLRSPAAFASLGALLAALGIEFHGELFEQIVEALAALAGLMGLILSIFE